MKENCPAEVSLGNGQNTLAQFPILEGDVPLRLKAGLIKPRPEVGPNKDASSEWELSGLQHMWQNEWSLLR